jgi:hypothetical protein
MRGGDRRWFKRSTGEKRPGTGDNNITTTIEASEMQSSSRQGLNWDIVLEEEEEEATCMPSSTCGHPACPK